MKQIDYDDSGRNMFGIAPCPRCGNTHRWPTRPTHSTAPNVILCDQCGYQEPLEQPAES